MPIIHLNKHSKRENEIFELITNYCEHDQHLSERPVKKYIEDYFEKTNKTKTDIIFSFLIKIINSDKNGIKIEIKEYHDLDDELKKMIMLCAKYLVYENGINYYDKNTKTSIINYMNDILNVKKGLDIILVEILEFYEITDNYDFFEYSQFDIIKESRKKKRYDFGDDEDFKNIQEYDENFEGTEINYYGYSYGNK